MLAFNCLLIVYFTIVGFGIGGYASIRTFVDSIHKLGEYLSACMRQVLASVMLSGIDAPCRKY